jgi:hypothetical protein
MITEQEAINLARKAAEDEGWPWLEPGMATWHPTWFGRGSKWEVFSFAFGLGSKVRVVVDAQTGEILEKGYVPR